MAHRNVEATPARAHPACRRASTSPVTGATHLSRQIPFRCASWAAAILLAAVGPAIGVEWIRAGGNTNQPVWGLSGGLQFAVHPGGFTGGDGGPRGLIRIGYPTLTNGKCDLVNFIAVEPVVDGKRGYSELEPSRFDGRQGKWFGTGPTPPTNGAPAPLNPGAISSPQPGVEELVVPVHVERFDNGAHVRLILSQRSDAPDELRLTVHAESDSAPIESCILTATMGNKARTRLLWLKDETVSSLELFGDHTGTGFTRHAFFPLARLPRNTAGDVLIAISTNEDHPAAALAATDIWKYRGEKVTQYWRKPAFDLNDALRCAVNARFTYWMSRNPIPGGPAFENFELVEEFKDGQQFIFGVTRRTPVELLR